MFNNNTTFTHLEKCHDCESRKFSECAHPQYTLLSLQFAADFIGIVLQLYRVLIPPCVLFEADVQHDPVVNRTIHKSFSQDAKFVIKKVGD